MHVSWGATRFVILIGSVAIKIARPRLFRALQRLYYHQRRGEVREKLLAIANNPVVAIVKFLCAGIIANRNEYRLWHESPRQYFVPTLFSFGWLVNVQLRGTHVRPEELEIDHPFRALLERRSPGFIADMTKPANFCRYEGRVCLADYGSQETFICFSRPQAGDATLVNITT